VSQVYQLVVNAQNPQAYGQSKTAADNALARNPNNPIYTLNEAQLALTKQDTDTAFSYIAQALALKKDYLDAYILKAQIEVGQGDTGAGVREITAYTAVAPYDAQGYLLLGQAQLQAKNYPDAVAAFIQAHDLAPTDPNIYLDYIGALEVAGEKTQAIAALQAFHKQFPNITGVDQQIQRIQNAPAVTSTPPAVSTAPAVTTAPTPAKKK
jgi:tetratricopeptide (TPR) repeat protein